MNIIKKNRVIAVILIVGIILIIWISNRNSNKRLELAVSEFSLILEKENQLKADISNLYKEYSECFDPKSSEISTFCVEGLPRIKNKLSKESDLLSSLEYFYENRKNDLDYESKIFIENNVKLVSSKEFKDVYVATNDVLDAYIDFYLYLNEEIDTNQINSTSTEEDRLNIIAKGIADYNTRRELVLKNIDDSSEKLDLKRKALDTYMEENFSDDFIEILKTN